MPIHTVSQYLLNNWWFTQRILNHAEVFSKPIRNVVYAYSQWQPAFQEIRDNDSSVVFHEGLPTKDDLSAWSEKEGGLLLVLDDLVYRVIQSFDYMELLTIHVHHMNISVIFISQNLFPQGKYSRVISLNCQYLVLFGNPRDNFQVKFLSTQLYPGQTKYFLDAYEKATQKPYSYLLIDLTVGGNRDYGREYFPGTCWRCTWNDERETSTKLGLLKLISYCVYQTATSVVRNHQCSATENVIGSHL